MSSSRRPPRSRYRFGFKGKRSGRNPQGARTDEILDSLTRHAKLMQKDGEERTVGLETILEIESNQELRQPWRFEPGPTVKPLRSWNSGLYAFVAMLMGGLAFLWIYSRLPQTLSLQSFATMQQAISRSAFEDWQKVALIALSAFAIALVARHSRDSVPTHLLSTN